MTHKKMNPEAKAKWLAALCSGKYIQDKGMLERREGGKAVGNCCLGVLLRSQGVKPQIKKDDVAFGHDRNGNPEYSVLTPHYLEKFGIDVDSMNHLWHMNDRVGNSFKQIAAWIERNL